MKVFTIFISLLLPFIMNCGPESSVKKCPSELKMAQEAKKRLGFQLNLARVKPSENSVALAREARGHCKTLLNFGNEYNGCHLSPIEIYDTADNIDCRHILIEDCPNDLNERIKAFVDSAHHFVNNIKEAKLKGLSLSISDIIARKADLKTDCLEIAESHPEITQCIADVDIFEKKKMIKTCNEL